MALSESLKTLDERLSAAASTSYQSQQPWSPELIKFLAVSVLLFVALALTLATVLLVKSRASSTSVIKIFGIFTIIGMSAFLVIVSYSNEQLTPIIGLFGAIAGYLLGKDNTEGHGNNQQLNAQQGAPDDPPAAASQRPEGG